MEYGSSSSSLSYCEGVVGLTVMSVWCHLGNAQFSNFYVGFLEGENIGNLRREEV